ncbi:LLM class flavin-dependent oxidoreductase [Novosphingobium sp. UBA1939]|uniref:LLM class flavin-dependent oxidoreductase n=1 Tax=Novosphingobium sp. UBA1939 TaxID=1946982 RepID=UPI0025F2458A|nr:LLM class flavin-dependent oxidoreductase [Novosphingobium sp. UBA1939]
MQTRGKTNLWRPCLTESRHVRTGVFLPPHHGNDEDVSLCMQRDFELVQWLEYLGFSEVWMGEHHSGGMQIYGSPDLFIAAAAERTSRIRIGAGVISVPYHHPYMIADRMIQLDHQTRGRAMFGFGPGMLVSDAAMLGIAPEQQRARLVEGVDVIHRLVSGEVVTHDSEWFTLRDASMQLSPYSHPLPEMTVVTSRTPVGSRLAGRYNFGILTHGGGDVNASWALAEETGREFGNQLSRDNLRVVVSFHLAETREEAAKAVEFGLEPWMRYLEALNPASYADSRAKAGNDAAKLIALRGGLVGTPDDAVEFLERMWERTGPFGCLLMTGTNWMNFEATKRSYELMMRYVMPRFNKANRQRERSFDWVYENREAFSGANIAAINKAVASAGRP